MFLRLFTRAPMISISFDYSCSIILIGKDKYFEGSKKEREGQINQIFLSIFVEIRGVLCFNPVYIKSKSGFNVRFFLRTTA